MKDRKFFGRWFNLFFLSIFVLFFANSAILLYLSNHDLVTASTESYSHQAETICQKLEDSLLTPLAGIVFNQFGSFKNSSMMDFLIYEKNSEFAHELSQEITTDILRHEWLKSIIVYRENGQLVTDYNMQKYLGNSVHKIQLQGIINCIIKKNSVSGWLSSGAMNYESEQSLLYYIKYPITNPSRNRGTIIYVINPSFLADEIKKSANPAVVSAILEDDDSQILFRYGGVGIPSWLNATRPKNLEATSLWKGNDKEWQVIWKPLPYQKMSLALVVSTSTFHKNLLYSQRINIILTLLFIIGLAVYLLFIKSRVQNPLAKIMDALHNAIHIHGPPARKSSLKSDAARIVDENKNLITYRFLINLLTEGIEREDFLHIGQSLGIQYCTSPFHIILVEYNPLPSQNLTWEEREEREAAFQGQWEENIPPDRMLCVRYPAGSLVCLCFVDSSYSLPIASLLRYAQKTNSNIVFSMVQTDTSDCPKIYGSLTNVLDNKVYYGYGNVFPPGDSGFPVYSIFPTNELKGLLLGDRYKEFKNLLMKSFKKMEKDGAPPMVIRDYFIRISEIINETYQKKSRIKDNMELSYATMREEIKKLSGVEEFISWVEIKLQILKKVVLSAEEESNKELVARIKKFILLSLDKNLTQETVAEHFRISPGHLSRLFREYSTDGFSVYIKNSKLEEAAKRLKERRCNSIASLARDLGYSSPAYFSRQFKKRFGQLPHEYAKRIENT